jgi:thymidylate synthase (FAD)
MKIVTEPLVYLINRPSLDIDALSRFIMDIGANGFLSKIDHTKYSPGDLLPMIAGKICYNAFNYGRFDVKEYIANILKQGHFSVLEHVSYSFIITNISRATAMQHNRHRIASISQRSQRFVNESDAKIVFTPFMLEHLDKDDLERLQWLIKSVFEEYQLLMKKMETSFSDGGKKIGTLMRKHLRSSARYILPEGVVTTLMWTANIRSIRHYLRLRAHKAADIEIRMLANRIYDILLNECPILLQDTSKRKLDDGTFEVVFEYGE